MRKIKLFLSLLMLIAFSVGNVWADKSTLTFTAACGGSGTADDKAAWTVTSDASSESAFDNTKGIHYGTSSVQVKYIRLSTSGIPGTITQVKVNASTASGVTATVAVKVGTTDFTGGTPASATQSLTSSAANYTFTGEASGDILVEITKSAKAAKALYCKSIEVTYTKSSVVNVSSVELDESSITLNEDDTQTLTATISPDNATNKNVTWESDDEDVATVENGVVTAVGAGDAVITCKSVADNTKSATCNVHVNSPYTKSKLIFTAACGGSGTADDGAEWAVTSDANESVYDGTSGIHYGTNSANVTYVQLATSDITGEVAKVVVNARDAQATATISVTVGGTAFTCASATATNTSADYVFTGTGSGEIVVRVDRGSSMSKAIYVKSVVVSYTPAAVEVKKPTFSVEAGSYLEAQSVELNCTTTGADIYYTLNGDDPDENSTHYEGAIPVSTTTTIKAIAILGTTSSPIATATYTIINTAHAGTAEDPYSVADAKIVIDGIGTKEDAYVSGIISQVDSYNSTYKSITYWISADGTTSGQQLQVYSGKGIDGADFSSVDDVVAKATVVVKGTLKMHSEIYEFDYNNELVSYLAPVEPVVTLKQAGSTVTSLNLDATSVANQAIDVECANFADAISSVTAELYEESTCDTKITSGAWVTDITVNGAKDQVTFNVADNAGEARQVWMKVTASDGSNSAFAVLNIKQAKYTVDYAELPFAYDGNGSGELPNGFTNSGVGTYSSSPAMKFDGTGDYITIKINAAPGTLTYDIKGNSFSGGTFKVQQSEDGTIYTDVETYTTLGDKQSESKTLEQDTRYVKFIYTEKSSGNVALGNIGITAYVAPVVTPTVSADPDEVEVDAAAHAGQSLVLTYENWGTVNVDEVEATLWNDAACTDNFNGGWISNVAVAVGNASVSFDVAANTGDARAAYMKIYALGDDGDTDAQTIVSISQAKYSAPSGTFELFSGDLADGEYVICSGTNAMKNVTTSSPRIDVETVIVSENKIQNPDEGLIWKIEALTGDDAGKWTIYNESAGVYAAFNTTDGRGVLLDAVTDYAKWTTSGTYDFINVGKTSKNYLRYNDGYGFASYATTTGEELTLYKKSDGKPAAPTFTPAAGSYLGTQNVTISAAAGVDEIRYTLNGSTPTASSILYTGAIEVSATTTIKAIAIKDAVEGNVATATYTIINTEHAGTVEDPYSVADAKAVIDGIGTKEDAYVSGIISQVDSYNSTYKSITYWISADGTTSGQQLQVYSGKGIDGADFSSVDDVVAKATVVVKGTLKMHSEIYEFDYNNELVSYLAPVEPVVTLKQAGSTVTSLNLDATSVANQAIDVECANFADAISSVTAELYEESTCDTKITSGAWVTDITVNGAKDQVTFNVADNAGEARQVWMKVTASDGSNSAFAVLNIKQAKYTVDYAELPFAFDGGRADIATTNGMTQVGLDSDYGSSPKLKFNTTGDNLIIHINEAPGKLTYDIKNNSFADGTFTVQESEDGENYTIVASHTEITGTQNEEVDLKQATRYVKFIYTEKVDGNVGLGNITISKYEAPTYTEVRNGLNAGEYYTMCLDKAVTAVQGGSIWRVLSKAENGTDVILEEVEGTLDAGRPYIFFATAATLEVAYTGAAVGAPITEDNNGLIGSFTKKLIEQAATNYIIYNNALYFVNSANVYVGEHRAYLDMTEVPNYNNQPQQGNAPRRRVTMAVHGPQVATGIDALNASDAPVKVLINGQLFILRGEKMYNVNGQLVK